MIGNEAINIGVICPKFRFCTGFWLRKRKISGPLLFPFRNPINGIIAVKSRPSRVGAVVKL